MSCLKRDTSSLKTEIERLQRANQALTSEGEQLKNVQTRLTKQNAELERVRTALEQEMALLKREKADLHRQITELKQAVSSSPERRPPGDSQVTAPLGANEVRPSSDTNAKKGPCNWLIAYMHKVESVFQQHSISDQKDVDQRLLLIQGLKKDYESRISEAPREARIAAEAWIDEWSRSWNKPREDTVFLLIQKRDAVLKACHMDLTRTGF